MSQEAKSGRIADDFPSIAARMREISGQSRQVAAPLECRACNGRGWLWSSDIRDWRKCAHCRSSEYMPKPLPPRR